MSRVERRTFLIAAAATLAAPFAVRGQPPARVYRIGFLSSEAPSAWANRVAALRAGLRELGYVEGKNLAIEFRWAEGKYERLPGLAADLVRLGPDVIVTGATPASRAAKQATATIPIVIAAVGDAVEYGFVASLARPGGNITGSTFFSLELSAKRIELLKEALPHARRIAVLNNPDNPGNASTLRAVQGAARSLQIVTQVFEARRPNDLEGAFAAMAKARVDAVAIPQQPIFNANAERVAEYAARQRLASIGGAEFAQAGCLLGYGASFIELYRGAAAFVDKILRGARPGDLPVEQATKFELVVNRRTAKAIGADVSRTILERADRVID